MSIVDIIRAWEDREYRESLSEEERAKLPENPVGLIELTEEEMTEIVGAASGNFTFCGSKGVNCNTGNCVGNSRTPPKCSQ
jgi:mersacidin/lichenicidin family type 2 lantibiotic